MVFGSVLWSPDETKIADDLAMAMYDVSTGQPLYKLGSTADSTSIRGQEFAELTQENTIQFRNLADGRAVSGVAEIRNEDLADANSIEFSPTGRFLATDDGAVGNVED